MDEQVRLLSLAHLHNGKTPTETSELMDISYASALKLKKALLVAEKDGKIEHLFKLDEAALNILLDGVRKQLVPAIDAFGIGKLVDEEVDELTKGINGAKLLSIELQGAASTLVTKITTVAVTATNADTIVSLSEALCKLQIAFKTTDINPLQITSFERHLRK